MSEFLHKMAEGLRTREKFLEDHDEHPVFNLDDGKHFRQEYEALLADVRAFGDRIKTLRSAKQDFDEHFEKEIKDANEKIFVEIDTWHKKLPLKD